MLSESDVKVKMKFESLPNEMIIECFEYLNGPDIFYSFDQLNYRFYTLIRSIRLHVNFQTVRKLIFMKFCQETLSDPDIKHQIISLNLLNDPRFGQVGIFLSYFSFIEFPHLQSLTLVGNIDPKTIEQIISTLPSLEYLCSFDMLNSASLNSQQLLDLSKLKLQILSLPNLSYDLRFLDQAVTITSLRVASYYVESLYKLFEWIPMLKYLDIKKLIISDGRNSTVQPPKIAIYLKQLTIDIYLNRVLRGSTDYESFFFVNLEILLKRTPNLEVLTVSAKDNYDIIAADRWQNTITSSLYHLDIFQFYFSFNICAGYGNINLDKFQLFQTDFWHTQNRWYTNYEVNNDSAFIYTVPYILNKYRLTSNRNNYWSPFVSSDIFSNVRRLELPIYIITKIKNSQHYFRNVESLELTNIYDPTGGTSNSKFTLEIEHITSLKTIINLSNIKHLNIWYNAGLKSSFVLLEILKEAPQLSLLHLETGTLMSFLRNDELCEYLNKMIKRLKINTNRNNNMNKFGDIGLFCKTFTNLEYLSCWIDSSENLLFILRKLSKLSEIKFYYESGTFPQGTHLWLAQNALKLNNNCVFDYHVDR